MQHRVGDLKLLQTCLQLAAIDSHIPLTFRVRTPRAYLELFSATADKTICVRASFMGSEAVTVISSQPSEEQRPTEVGLFIPLETNGERVDFSISTTAVATFKQIRNIVHLIENLGLMSCEVSSILPTTRVRAFSITLKNMMVRLNGKTASHVLGEPEAEGGTTTKTDDIGLLDSSTIGSFSLRYFVPLISDSALIASSMLALSFKKSEDNRIFITIIPQYLLTLVEQTLQATRKVPDKTFTLTFTQGRLEGTTEAAYQIEFWLDSTITGGRVSTMLPLNLKENNKGNTWLRWTPHSIWVDSSVTLNRVQLTILVKILRVYITNVTESEITLILTQTYELVLRLPITALGGERVAIFTYIFSGGVNL
ncbi:hypothetical protein GMRT_14350 [Giardia muris]|uniref:Uncharacterized protein n=1 Tax=Giardia muris TaxID=5742 RepID=A0A4Z1SXE6_GIAMU|nr:hypothetical protein GMRT_14350 [Giardia muris]|eukprot:TNJ28198.1 hypothetical protein GMRT_14350 [Giardia muris]